MKYSEEKKKEEKKKNKTKNPEPALLEGQTLALVFDLLNDMFPF